MKVIQWMRESNKFDSCSVTAPRNEVDESFKEGGGASDAHDGERLAAKQGVHDAHEAASDEGLHHADLKGEGLKMLYISISENSLT